MLRETKVKNTQKKDFQPLVLEVTLFSVGDTIATSTGSGEEETRQSLDFDFDPDAGKWH